MRPFYICNHCFSGSVVSVLFISEQSITRSEWSEWRIDVCHSRESEELTFVTVVTVKDVQHLSQLWEWKTGVCHSCGTKELTFVVVMRVKTDVCYSRESEHTGQTTDLSHSDLSKELTFLTATWVKNWPFSQRSEWRIYISHNDLSEELTFLTTIWVKNWPFSQRSE